MLILLTNDSDGRQVVVNTTEIESARLADDTVHSRTNTRLETKRGQLFVRETPAELYRLEQRAYGLDK